MFNMKLEEKKMAKFSSGYLEIKKTKRAFGIAVGKHFSKNLNFFFFFFFL
jgi:hypothetical protein